jgi:hypothetical protein
MQTSADDTPLLLYQTTDRAILALISASHIGRRPGLAAIRSTSVNCVRCPPGRPPPA